MAGVSAYVRGWASRFGPDQARAGKRDRALQRMICVTRFHSELSGGPPAGAEDRKDDRPRKGDPDAPAWQLPRMRPINYLRYDRDEPDRKVIDVGCMHW